MNHNKRKNWMPKQAFNEPELYLIKNWSDAHLLEESMEAVRNKYGEIFGSVLDAVEKEHPELKSRSVQVASYGGIAGIARETWPSMYSAWPSGLWIGNICLEGLVSDDSEAPEASVWIKPPKDGGVDLQEAARKLEQGAVKVLGRKEAKRVSTKCTRSEAYLWYPLPEKRQDLLQMLVTDGAQRFIDCIFAHFDVLARFIPVMDEIFTGARRKRR